MTSPAAIRAVRVGRRRQLGSARVIDGEAMPAVGDVLAFGQSSAGRVELVHERTVWWSMAPFDDVPVGAGRWEFLPPAGRFGAERLRRRRVVVAGEVA